MPAEREQLEIKLLGTPEVRLNGRVLSFASSKALALLAYLALSGETHGRVEIATLLWPESDEKSGRNALRYTLSVLQKEIGKGWLVTSRETLALPHDDHDHLTVDVLAFQQYALSDRVNDWHTAVSLYESHFMAGFTLRDALPFDEWQRATAEHLRVLSTQTYVQLLEATQDTEQLLTLGQALLALDPLSEAAYRGLMRGHHAQGQYNEGLRLYEQCVAVLYEELGVDPAPETTAVYEQIIVDRAINQNQPANSFQLPSLPTPAANFVGREAELAKLRQLYAQGARLVTILGAGGMGKTRLAQEAAVQLQTQFADGVAYAPLTAAQTNLEVITGLGTAVGMNIADGAPPLEQLQTYLHGRELLLVLDNLEHLLNEPFLDLITDLLHTLPTLAILATTRERLQLHAAHLLPLRGLAQTGYSETLFQQRAARYCDPATLDPEMVRHICQLVQGIPLAIELAAAQTATLSLPDIAANLQHNLDILAAPYHDGQTRHSSMRAVLENTWAGLMVSQKTMLMGLAVFRGGATLNAAQAVAGGTVRDWQNLVESSLVWHTHGRYELHELMRQFAAEKLAEQNETTAVSGKHARYFYSQLTQTDRSALTHLTAESDNLRAAWERLAQGNTSEAHNQAVQMTIPMWRFYRAHNRFSEGENFLSDALAWIQHHPQLADEKRDERAEWWRLRGLSWERLGNITEAITHFRRATAVASYPIPQNSVGQMAHLGRGLLPQLLPASLSFSAPTPADPRLITATKAHIHITSLAYQNDQTLLSLLACVRTLNLAAQTADVVLNVQALGNGQGLWRSLKWHRRAERNRQQVLQLIAQNDLPAEAAVIALTGIVAWDFGYRPWAALLGSIDEAMGYAAQMEDKTMIGTTAIVKSFVLYLSGNFRENLRHNALFEQLAEQANNVLYALYAQGIPMLWLWLGEREKAEEMRQRAIELLPRIDQNNPTAVWTVAQLADFALWDGDVQEAVRLVDEKIDPMLQGLPFNALVFNTYVVAVRVWLAARQNPLHTSYTEAKLRRALRRLWLFSRSHLISKPSYHLCRGLYWAEKRGALALARWHWRHGLQLAEKLDMPHMAAQFFAAQSEYAPNQAQHELYLQEAITRLQVLGLLGEVAHLKQRLPQSDLE